MENQKSTLLFKKKSKEEIKEIVSPKIDKEKEFRRKDKNLIKKILKIGRDKKEEIQRIERN